MTIKQLPRLFLSLEEAARAYGLGLTLAYELAARNPAKLPFPVYNVGTQRRGSYRVPLGIAAQRLGMSKTALIAWLRANPSHPARSA